MRIQLSSVESDIKEICKNIKQCHSPYSVYFGKFNYFSRNVILLTYNGFIIVIFKWNNIQRFSQKIWQMSIDTIPNSIILVYLTIFENVKGPEGLPWWFSGRESAYQCRRCGFQPRVRKIPWRRKRQPTPVFLPEKFHRHRSLEGYSPWGRKRAGHELVAKQRTKKGPKTEVWELLL